GYYCQTWTTGIDVF
nr:immunoglobulin light chain junction region [Macaca mulatta]MOW58992.1 immunoglobulin light chain junction region [Macaca mulatta]MOW60911.1 immunoglobulin light chain junction region [Macaca mulatta]